MTYCVIWNDVIDQVYIDSLEIKNGLCTREIYNDKNDQKFGTIWNCLIEDSDRYLRIIFEDEEYFLAFLMRVPDADFFQIDNNSC